jgi:hypothetical protein
MEVGILWVDKCNPLFDGMFPPADVNGWKGRLII